MSDHTWWRRPAVIDITVVLFALIDPVVNLLWDAPEHAAATVVAAAGLLLRRRWPWVSLLIALPALLVGAGNIAALIALYTVAVTSGRLRIAICAGALVFASSAPWWWGARNPGDSASDLVYAIATTAAPIAFGLLMRTRRELAARVDELRTARRAEQEHERNEILAAERTRIAREMHDVVSHQVSLIAVQAGALQVSAQETETRHTAVTIRELAVRTLDELRQMVALLRTNVSSTDSLAPQPTLSDLDRVIRESGLLVTSSITFTGTIPPAAQRAVYRTVQEALTNIRKHAPGATTTVEVAQDGGELVATIWNTLPGNPVLGLPGGGTGLIGLRERAALLGGTFHTRRTVDAFTVELRLPL